MLEEIPPIANANAPTIYRTQVRSKRLARNQAGFDAVRPLTVFLPAGWESGKKFPIIYALAPWTAAGRSQFEWQPFKESLADRLQRLMSAQQMPPCIVVAPDLYTDFGGSQYVNSAFFGPHGDFLTQELVPFMEQRFPVLAGARHRAVFGRSSGGFGALRLAMDYPGVFQAIACHSGDMGFEHVYRRELVQLIAALKRYQGDPQLFIDYCRIAPKLSGFDTHILMLLAMAGFYSPNPHTATGFELPIDLENGEIREEIWAEWLAHDPVQRIDKTYQHLQTLKVCFLDCGGKDQYYLHLGARQLVKRLKKWGVSHCYEEFDDNHSGTQYRFDVSLPILAAAIG